MGLNSSDYASLFGAAISGYSPQAGATVQSLFAKPPPQPTAATQPQYVQPAAPTPFVAPNNKIPVYVWVVGGVLTLSLVLVLALKK